MLTCQRVAALHPTGQAQPTQGVGGGARLVQQKALHIYELANLLRACLSEVQIRVVRAVQIKYVMQRACKLGHAASVGVDM